MNDGFRRFSVLVGVFFLAFAVVFVVRRMQGGESFLELLGLGKDRENTEFRPEKYTLPEAPPVDPEHVKWLERLDAEYAALTAAVLPSVVSIDTEGVKPQLLPDLFGRGWEVGAAPVKGIGSGVIVTEEGHVITNQHVTDGQSKITVTLHDGESYPAVLIGEDRVLDIAVIRIEGNGREFQALPFVEDSDKVRLGQMVFAIGNPFGLGESITQGIISARERFVTETQRDLFQTDAAINPGNSGGPLVNLYGEIIGINNLIYSPDTEARGFHGIGFAIPANDAKESFFQLVERGRPIRSYLGVKLLPITPRWQQALGYRSEHGAMIHDVIADSPAAQCGLRPLDIVVDYNDEKVTTQEHFLSLLRRTKVGEKARMKVWRSGQVVDLEAILIDADDGKAAERPEPKTRTASEAEIDSRVGLRVRKLSERERDVRILAGSVAVAEVRYGSMSVHIVRPGDYILRVNGARVPTPAQFYAELFAAVGAGQAVEFQVYRHKVGTFAVSLPPIPRTVADPE